MVPSVDRVGRYFPLTLVAELPAGANLAAVPTDASTFFENAEQLVDRRARGRTPRFRQLRSAGEPAGRRSRVGDPRAATRPGSGGGAILGGEAGAGRWQVPIGSAPQLQAAFQQLLSRRLESLYDPLVLWWTGGIVDGRAELPDRSTACRIRRRSPRCWTARGPNGSGAACRSSSTSRRLPKCCIDEADRAGGFGSAAATDVGRVRQVNQDSFIERTEVGMWAVADGVGGHSHGEVASRMVCDAIADVVPERQLCGRHRQRPPAARPRERVSRPFSRAVRSPVAAAARWWCC